MKEIIDTVVNGKAGLCNIHSVGGQKNPRANRRKMVSEEIHHLEEVTRFATAVGQWTQSAWTKWENVKDRAVTWRDLKHMDPKKLSFLIKAVYCGTIASRHLVGRWFRDYHMCRLVFLCFFPRPRCFQIRGKRRWLRSSRWRLEFVLEEMKKLPSKFKKWRK